MKGKAYSERLNTCSVDKSLFFIIGGKLESLGVTQCWNRKIEFRKFNLIDEHEDLFNVVRGHSSLYSSTGVASEIIEDECCFVIYTTRGHACHQACHVLIRRAGSKNVD